MLFYFSKDKYADKSTKDGKSEYTIRTNSRRIK